MRVSWPASGIGGAVMISQRAKYAFRALGFLARAEQGLPVQIPEIAEKQKIPKKFLEQILLELKRAGILESRRGKQGGYLLARPADEITYGEVLRLVDGPVALLPCLSLIAYRPCEDCDGETDCEIRRVFARVAEETRAVLLTTSLASAAAEPTNERG
jgi:Rrf2 family protein